jgi:hypothetical protein
LGLILGLANTILCQQLAEDAGLKLVDALRKIEKQFLAGYSSEPAAATATSKLGGDAE